MTKVKCRMLVDDGEWDAELTKAIVRLAGHVRIKSMQSENTQRVFLPIHDFPWGSINSSNRNSSRARLCVLYKGFIPRTAGKAREKESRKRSRLFAMA